MGTDIPFALTNIHFWGTAERGLFWSKLSIGKRVHRRARYAVRKSGFRTSGRIKNRASPGLGKSCARLAKWEHNFSAELSAATEALIDMAGIRPSMRVLDLACGAGSQTIEAARRVGPDGSVVACDISATMLDHLRKNAATAGLQNVETLECAAEDLNETLSPF